MTGCRHIFESKGVYYTRKNAFLGGQLFTVYRSRECVHCGKHEVNVVRKKKVSDSADIYERQLRFSGVKPENLLN